MAAGQVCEFKFPVQMLAKFYVDCYPLNEQIVFFHFGHTFIVLRKCAHYNSKSR